MFGANLIERCAEEGVDEGELFRGDLRCSCGALLQLGEDPSESVELPGACDTCGRIEREAINQKEAAPIEVAGPDDEFPW